MPASATTRYTLAGALFGACFPVVGTALLLAHRGLGWSPAAALALQAGEPLLWIIDSAPLWLALFARMGGVRQDRVDAWASTLEARVEARTAELARARREAEAACAEADRQKQRMETALAELEAARRGEGEANARARRLADHVTALPSPLVEVDAAGRIVYANRAFHRMVGTTPDEHARLADLVRFDGPDPVARALADAAPSTTPTRVTSRRTRRRTEMTCAVTPLRATGGGSPGRSRAAGAMVFFLDRSDVAREAGRLRQAGTDVDDAATELSRSAASLLDGLRAIEEATRETSATSEHLVDQVRVTADGAEEIGVVIRELASNAREVSASTTEARARVERARRSSAEVVALSREVASLADEIAAIARQTRLLALNASIRAADNRSRDLGFQAVATEVKLLAGRAGRAARTVSEAMERLRAHIEALDGEVGTTRDAIGEIDDAMAHIAGAIATQTQEVERIARAAARSSQDLATVARSTREVMAGLTQARVEADGVTARAAALAGMAEDMRAPRDDRGAA